MAKPGEPFDKDEEKRIQQAIDEYQKSKRDHEIQDEINRRIYELENGNNKKKK